MLTRAQLLALPVRPATVEWTVDAGCALAECPTWVVETGTLHWVDAERGILHALRRHNHTSRRVAADDALSAIAIRENGAGVLIGGRRITELASGRVLAELVGGDPHVRFNDAKVGPDGALWAGTVLRGAAEPTGLFALRIGGTLRRYPSPGAFGNGIGWSLGGARMLVVDSALRTVTRYRFDRASGPSPGGDVLLHLADDVGLPDGLTIDATGTLWLAIWGAGCILRLDPDGTPLQRVDMAEPNVTSCGFAGLRLDRLAVTTATDPTGRAAGGSVHLLDVGVSGRPGYRFGARGDAA